MSIFTTINDEIAEEASGRVTFQMTDETGLPNTLLLAQISALTITQYLPGSLTIINSRNAQDALNANDVAIDANANVVWTVTPEDNAMIGSGEDEKHITRFDWSFDSGVKKGKHLIIRTVINLDLVP